MTTGHVFIATSLDGFIARADGDVDWLSKYVVEGEDTGYDAMIASIDGLVMGSGTYQKVLTFGEWPYPKPVVVVSRSIKQEDIPANLRERVRVTDKSPAELMEELDEHGWKRAYVDGGRLIQSFLNQGLIEDMIVTNVPILIGSGLPLFGSMPEDIELEHFGTRSFPSGLVSSKYKVLKDSQAARL